MTPHEHAALDDETVFLMEETTWRCPRDYLGCCLRCESPFWIHPTSGGQTRYCTDLCRIDAVSSRRRESRRSRRRSGMAEQEHARLDEETIRLMTCTSHDGSPISFLRDCAHCGAPFWVTNPSGVGIYCTTLCCMQAFYRRHRDRMLAKDRAYQARRRLERRAVAA